MNRFHFQWNCVAATTGRCLNMGSKEDPAKLKRLGDRVLNCDISTWDTDYQQEIELDVVMDCRKPWPFEDNSAEIVVFGDILEHLYLVEATFALTEAYRVANKLCVTVPTEANTHRIQGGEDLWERPEGNRGHCMDWTSDLLCETLTSVGWTVITIEKTFNGIVPLELLLYAEK